MAAASKSVMGAPIKVQALVQSPYTLGGDADLRLVKLDDAHFKQRDTSQNDAVWGLLDLDAKLDTESLSAPPADKRLAVIEHQTREKDILSGKVALLKHISQLLGSTCSHMSYLRPARLARLKEGGCVEPIAYAVGKGFHDKVLGNRMFQAKDYPAATRIYVHALTDLAPWYASPLLFTEKQATDLGFANLEPALWTNLSLCLYLHALTVLKGDAGLPAALAALGPVLSSHVRGTELLRAAELAALQAIEARYITPDLLKKGYHHYARALQARVEAINPADRKEWTKAVRQLQQASEKVKVTEGLAHSLCKEEHVCIGESKEQK